MSGVFSFQYFHFCFKAIASGSPPPSPFSSFQYFISNDSMVIDQSHLLEDEEPQQGVGESERKVEIMISKPIYINRETQFNTSCM